MQGQETGGYRRNFSAAPVRAARVTRQAAPVDGDARRKARRVALPLWPRRSAPPQPPRRSARLIRPERSLTASAVTVSRGASGGLRRLAQPWHSRALDYYDTVGECWYPAQFYARVLPKIRFFPAILDERGDPQEVETGPLAELWERVQDPGGGRSELTGGYGRLMFLTGDGYLVVTEDEDEGEAWEFLSPLELRIKPDTGGPPEYQRIRAPGITPEELVEAPDSDFSPQGIDQARVWRLYRRHPAYSAWSDSPVRAVLDLYELVKLLTLAAGAEAQSRAASRGMLYIPDELSFASTDAIGDEDPEADQFLHELQEMLVANIKDPASAGAMSPLMLRGPGTCPTGLGTSLPMADLIRWFPLGPDDKYVALTAMAQVIERISFGLDMPSEVVTGTGDVNHWGSWMLDEQGYRQHVAPVAQKFADDMASAYLRPAAREGNIAGWENVVLGIDPAEAINHPDATETAKEGWRNAVVGAQFYREAIGATEDDAPSDEEIELILALQSKVPPGAPVGEEEGETAPEDGGTGDDADEGPPPVEDAPSSRNAQTAAAAFKIIGAAESAVDRARAKAGARLVSRSKGCSECKDAIAGVNQSHVASALGMEQVRRLTVTEAELVAGSGDELARTISRWGVSGEWTGEIGRLVEQHAVRTLYETDPPPLPAGFAAVVTRALQAA